MVGLVPSCLGGLRGPIGCKHSTCSSLGSAAAAGTAVVGSSAPSLPNKACSVLPGGQGSHCPRRRLHLVPRTKARARAAALTSGAATGGAPALCTVDPVFLCQTRCLWKVIVIDVGIWPQVVGGLVRNPRKNLRLIFFLATNFGFMGNLQRWCQDNPLPSCL